VRAFAKASSAGSNEGKGNSRRLFRRAFAGPHAPGASSGSGACRRPASFILAVGLFAIAALFGASGASAAEPVVSIASVGTPSYDSVAVEGKVDPGGEFTEYFFQVSSDGANWNFPGGDGVGGSAEGSGEQSVSATFKSLKGGTTYQVRIFAFNSSGFVVSPEPYSEFTTLPVDLPTADEVEFSGVESTIADVSGKVTRPANPDHAFDVKCRFEYVTDEQFNATGFEGAAATDCAQNSIEVPGQKDVDAALTGLSPNTTYHLRLSAENAGGVDSIVAVSTFATGSLAAPVVTIAPATLVTGTSAHFEGTVQPGGTDPGFNSECFFDYVTHAKFAAATPGEEFAAAQTVACDVNPVTGAAVTDVKADPGDLEPHTTYHLRLRTANLAGPGIAEAPTFTTEAIAPSILDTFFSGASSSAVTLSARINPGGAPTTVHFDYLTLAEYEANGGTFAGAKSTPESPSIGQDNTVHRADSDATGLQAGTAYRFRVVASNSMTPPGGLAGPVEGFLTANAPINPTDSCTNASIRSALGAGALGSCRAWELVSPDLNHASLSNAPRGKVMPDGESVLYYSVDAPEHAEFAAIENHTYARRNPVSGWSGHSVIPKLTEPVTAYLTTVPMSVSNDGTAVIMISDKAPRGASTPSGPAASHIWIARTDGTADRVTEVGLPFIPGIELFGGWEGLSSAYDFQTVFFKGGVAQTEDDPTPGASWYVWHDGTLDLLAEKAGGPGLAGAPAGGVLPPVSEDGDEVLFISSGDPGLYLRLDLAPGIEVSATQRTVEPDPNPAQTPQAVGITPDGSKVLFLSTSELTNDAYTGRTGGVSTDVAYNLYSYDVASGVLSDLTVSDSPADAERGADVSRVLAVNRDGSRIFFIASGNLAPGGASGEPSIYLWDDGEIEFVSPAAGVGAAQMSLDASSLAFTSTASLTGYNNTNPSTGAAMQEVYLWRPDSGLECASCRPDGSRPTSSASLGGLSANGERVFFQGSDRVLPQSAGTRSAVYEYYDGKVTPISRLGGNLESYFVASSPSGRDVFFATREALVPNKNAGDFLLYDARIGGGFPLAPQSCTGASCQGPLSTPPAAVAPASSLLSGHGNQRTKACPKGKVRKQGKCVKKVKKKNQQQDGKSRKGRSGGAK
jgi:hypothetical protein